MTTKTYGVAKQSHIEDLVDRLFDKYTRVEVIKSVKAAVGFTVMVAVGY